MKLHATSARMLWRFTRRALAVGCAAGLLTASIRVPSAAAQVTPEIVGRLSGDDVAVTGAASFNTSNGRTDAVLTSGSEITVRSGQARIVLSQGGEIAVCGPAHFSLLKSGDAITIALDYGRVHPFLEGSAQLTVYTPFVVATPIAIGQDSRDATVGLDQAGALCAVSARGAVRLEQQLSGQSMLVPQGGSVNMADGQLSAQGQAESSCGCDLQVARSITPKQLELSVPSAPSVSHPAAVAPPLDDAPVYMVYMPPLTFDSSAPAPPPAADPQTILLLREARVQPEVVFRGHVEDAAPHPAAAAPPVAAVAVPLRAEVASRPKSPGLLTRFFNLFRRKRAPCVGAGCAQARS